VHVLSDRARENNRTQRLTVDLDVPCFQQSRVLMFMLDSSPVLVMEAA
jgi:hypothetical protein